MAQWGLSRRRATKAEERQILLALIGWVLSIIHICGLLWYIIIRNFGIIIDMSVCFVDVSGMKRTIISELLNWKSKANKKPLVLKGARQVGKTWALQAFGEEQYCKRGYRCHYIDLRKAGGLHAVFKETLDPVEIIRQIEFHLRTTIDIRNDLLIFDEIQECPRAITAFKYFEQDLPELNLVAAGSHMGLLKNEESFPVGKVDFLYMFPMTFEEFVQAADAEAYHYLEKFDLKEPFPSIVHERLLQLFVFYSLTGGLPEVVSAFLKNGLTNVRESALAARSVQETLVVGYRSDFAKYSGVVNANHINSVFDAIPAQLSMAHDDEVKKFRFKQVIPRRKGFDSVRGPLAWLMESRLCIKTAIANRAGHPLKSYCADNRFKMFLFDVGILNCILDIPCEVLLDQKVGPYKGFMLENFVAQELFAVTNRDLTAWQEGTAELEFLIAAGKEIIPVEVKSAARNRRARSLDAFIARYDSPQAIKLTRQNFIKANSRRITTVPVYCCYKLPDYFSWKLYSV